MNHNANCKYLALICILISALLLICACTPTGGAEETTVADDSGSTLPAESTYKVTVKDDKGAAITGAIVQFNEGDKPFAITDANGTASVTAKTANYTVSIVVAGYEVESSYAFTAGATELNVTLKSTAAATVDYKVTVVDEAGAPLADVKVQLCVGDLCQLPIFTNASGIAIVSAAEDNYTAKITKDGYTGEAEYTFPEGSREMTVTLTKN